jgi:uncharacterized protein YbjT (DUF2867 family)
MADSKQQTGSETTLVLGGTGKTGRRVAQRLVARGLPTRIGSRSGQPPFDWEDRATWGPVLQGVGAVYVTYFPDLAFPGATERVSAFVNLAVREGVRRLVLLAGRGEPAAQAAEQAVRNSGTDWTIIRANWFAQNFSEPPLLDAVMSGEIALPAGAAVEPFVDAEDVAAVAAAALTGDAHAGQIYELSGPRLLTFDDVAAEISKAANREVRYVPITADECKKALAEQGRPTEFADLFEHILDGRNANLTDGVRRALGRAPRDFSDFARVAATTGVWRES